MATLFLFLSPVVSVVLIKVAEQASRIFPVLTVCPDYKTKLYMYLI